jgi:hypothetical protein
VKSTPYDEQQFSEWLFASVSQLSISRRNVDFADEDTIRPSIRVAQ